MTQFHLSLCVDKIVKNNSFLIILVLSHNSACVDTDLNFYSQQKENRAKGKFMRQPS